MPGEHENIIDDDKKPDEGGDKGSELTLETLQDGITSLKTEQAEAVTALKTESANSIAQLRQVIEDRDADIQNLTNLLGELANTNTKDSDEAEDLTDPENVRKLVNKTVNDNKQAASEAAEKTSKTYNKEYVSTVLELLDDELAPDGKPFSSEARKGILGIVKTDKDGVLTDNAIRDGHKNFKKAIKVYYGLDKTHGFKGGDIGGTGGGGGGENKGGNKKVYKLTPEAKKFLEDSGESEDWGQEQLRKRAEEQLV